MQIRLNIFFSIVLLLLGFITQIFVKSNYGIQVFGISVLIRLLNSESFYSLLDFGICEEVLFESESNKVGVCVRVLLTFSLIYCFTYNIDFLSLDLWNNRLILFLLLISSYMLTINKLYFKKVNKIMVVRIIDILISISFLGIYIFTANLPYVLAYLAFVNIIIVLVTIRFDLYKIFKLSEVPFSIVKSGSYYLTSLSSKLEGSLLSFVIPSFYSTDILGTIDIVTRIPKAFKSQLGEFNSLRKFAFLSGDRGHVNDEDDRDNNVVYLLSLIVLASSVLYMFALDINISYFYLFIILAELSVGLVLNKFNIKILGIFLLPNNRWIYVGASFGRSVLYIIIIFSLSSVISLETIIFLWYASFFIFYTFVYMRLLNR